MALTEPKRHPTWLLPTICWTAVLAGAMLLGGLAKSPFSPPPGVGRIAPRIPAPATDIPTLLFMLGVGSTVWYAAALAAPFLAWGARRLEPERTGWARTLVVTAGVLLLLTIAACAVDYYLDYAGLLNRPSFVGYLAVVGPRQLLPWAALGGLIGC